MDEADAALAAEETSGNNRIVWIEVLHEFARDAMDLCCKIRGKGVSRFSYRKARLTKCSDIQKASRRLAISELDVAYNTKRIYALQLVPKT